MQTQPKVRYHGMLIFLTLLNVLNMVDRNLLSSFGPDIVRDLELTDSQFGLLTGILFVFFYAVMGLFVGALADRVHRPRLIALGLVIWSGLTAFSGAAKNFFEIGMARLLVGVGESTLAPTSLAMLADVYPQKKRGMASGVFYLGIPLGAGASFLVAGLLGPTFGWRNCFYALGAIGVLLSIGVLMLKDPQRGQQEELSLPSSKETPKGLRETMPLVWQSIRTSPQMALTMLGAILFHVPLGASNFVQIWLVRERGFDNAEIATIYGLLFIVFGTVGGFLGGQLSDWFQSRFSGGRLRFLALLMLFFTPMFMCYRFSEPGSFRCYIGMCAGFVSFIAFYGPVFATVQDLASPAVRASTVALLLLLCNLVGIGAGAILAGFMSDALNSSGVTNPLTWSLIITDLIAALTIPCFLIASIYYEREKNKNTEVPTAASESDSPVPTGAI